MYWAGVCEILNRLNLNANHLIIHSQIKKESSAEPDAISFYIPFWRLFCSFHEVLCFILYEVHMS